MRSLAVLLLALTLGACSITDRRAGVDNLWRKAKAQPFVRGQTTRAEVLAALGPPSRILPLGQRSVLYYLLEHTYTTTFNLIVYIQTDSRVRYDRAVFFFNKDGRLEEYSVSREAIEREEER